MPKRSRPALLLFALIVSVSAVSSAATGLFGDPFDDLPFDPASWAAADEEGKGRMARGALRHLPAGTPAERVEDLLGRGEPLYRVGRVDVFGNEMRHPETWAYYIGSWSGLGRWNFDSAYLYVHFADGKVVGAEITGG